MASAGISGVVLTVLDHPATAGVLLAASRRLAELSGAGHVEALLVRTPPEESIAPSEEILSVQREAELRSVEATRSDAVRAVYDDWLSGTEQAGIKAEWVDIDGIAELIVEERGARADFLVVAQPGRHDYGTSWNAMRAALLATGRPVLVVPARSLDEFGRHVAIAWRDDERATKAVLAGLRCLTRAERVFLLAGVRDNAAPAMPAILSEHGVNAELYVLPIGPGAFGAALLAKAHQLGADMLMMGAYVHSPLRQLLFGGVTRYMLANADIPVLMRH
ncbi:MAG TPA: universal stress protein [Acetobacteraceae bacterium]|jgi:nucleotide-binding universal stress UspA family protein|nr:universal stress protein [Acetobacteraceae bacterium]